MIRCLVGSQVVNFLQSLSFLMICLRIIRQSKFLFVSTLILIISIYLKIIALKWVYQHLKSGENQSYIIIWLPGKIPRERKGC
jgi:hypothetical protein